MPIHPGIQDLLDVIEQRGLPPVYEMSPEEAREATLRGRRHLHGDFVPIAHVEDIEIPTQAHHIPVRIYSDIPQPAQQGKKQGTLVYFHGGGWVIGSVDSHDDLCRRLAKHSGCIIASVGYRLAPEHKFPAAVEDSWAALCWLHQHASRWGGDDNRMAVGGDSAGGNLAAVVAQRARDEGGPMLKWQLLIYPVTTMDFTLPSMSTYAEGCFLTLKGMQWFWQQYLQTPSQADEPSACPLKAANLSGLPAVRVITAGYDPLRDEGKLYAEALQAAGVETVWKEYPQMTHAFIVMSKVPDIRHIVQETALSLKQALS